MRWASNDYPNVVTAIDRISATPAVIYPILDEFFDGVMAETGDDQIYVIGHSQGTSIMYGYLAARRSGPHGWPSTSASTAPAPDVPRRRRVHGPVGAGEPGPGPRTVNVRLPDQGHTQSVGSAESFAAQYEFLTGTDPATTLVSSRAPARSRSPGGR